MLATSVFLSAPGAPSSAGERSRASSALSQRIPDLRPAAPVSPAASRREVSAFRRGGTQLVVEVCVDGELYIRIAGDGIVVATPVGSSAYSMAAGGSLLATGTNTFVCTPLAMHGGCAPPLVVPDDREVTIEIDPGHGGFDLEVDGFLVETEAHRFSVSSEQAYATLVVLDGSRSGLAWLRGRGLISDSPRVVARENQELHVRRET
jgi:NAD+ kinase